MQLFHFHADTVTSTNDVAIALLAEHDNVMVTANFQTAGRGRNGNVWIGNRGENVYCTFGINHRNGGIATMNAILYQALGGLAAIETLRKICRKKQTFRLKYPNDVMAMTKDNCFGKICGTICEQKFLGSSCISTIIGIGINISQTEFSVDAKNTPTSLKLLGENEIPAKIIKTLAESYQELLAKPFDFIFDLWKKELDFIGKTARIASYNGIWKINSLLPDGNVKLSGINDNTEITIDNGDSIRYDF